ncbi:hypothetical protein [Alkalicoccus urumqiensis]|uniref:Uncharacterized protein n=1 Tax=Alkalicoccus urumqiensis TaxID=1548213 RepID=A0A2P6MFI5_ALKUR|nr:hypothetical protein [Alkalicoccus urumqiensis]PRO65044.1 hypothetical protein C6I21_11390 [Alkalicoccus urumqiensis]
MTGAVLLLIVFFLIHVLFQNWYVTSMNVPLRDDQQVLSSFVWKVDRLLSFSLFASVIVIIQAFSSFYVWMFSALSLILFLRALFLFHASPRSVNWKFRAASAVWYSLGAFVYIGLF